MRENTQKTLKESELPPADKPVEADDLSGNSIQASSDDMNTEELAAFNKIMGEIEGDDDDAGADSPAEGEADSDPDSETSDGARRCCPRTLLRPLNSDGASSSSS